MSAILDDLQARGLLALTTDREALDAAFDAGPVTFYVGFDPTAPSLHIGNLVQILTARRLQDAGHRPLALVGGATGLIGDPSGKSAERSLNEREVVAAPTHKSGPRVGVSGVGGEGNRFPWRYWLTDERTVSAYRPAYRAPASVDVP